MFTKKNLVVALLIAAAPFIGACSKKKTKAKESAPPAAGLTPTDNTASPMQGTWTTFCETYSDDNGSVSYITTATFQGNLLTFQATSYNGTSCAGSGSKDQPRESHFKWTAIDEQSYTVNYTDGSYGGASETVTVVHTSPEELNFETEIDDSGNPVVFYKQ